MSLIDALPGIGGIVGGIAGAISSRKTAKENIQLQKDFAQQGIRWKVADATAAGIHPLYALGAQTHSFAPNPVGNDFGTIGQNIGSAVQAMATPAQKNDAFAKTVEGLTVEKMGLENEVLRSQLRLVSQPASGPGMPVQDRMIPGQGNTPSGEVMKTGFGLSLRTEPGVTPANKWSDQYGEPGDWLAGIANLASAAGLQTLGIKNWEDFKDWQRPSTSADPPARRVLNDLNRAFPRNTPASKSLFRLLQQIQEQL